MKKTLFFCTILLSFLFSKTNAQVWEPVGDPTGISAGGVGRLTLTCDQQDNLLVGYYDVSTAKGSVQKYDWVDWSYVGGGPGITTGTATYNSLSVNSLGAPFFTNQSPWPDLNMEVRTFENNEWVLLPNSTSGGVNFNTSTFSPDDVLFVADNAAGGTVKKFVNNEWVQVGASLGFTSGTLNYLDMVVGSNGKVYVSFNNGGLRVYEIDVNATENDPWQAVGGITPLAPAPSTENYNSSLAIDSQNNLYVAYVSSSGGGNKLNAKKFDGSVWTQLGDENFTTNRVQHISIAIAAGDIVYIAASRWENDDFLRNYVMAYDEIQNSWYQAGTGFASEGQGIYNSLTVDSFGNLYLAFSDSGLGGKLSVKKLNLNIVAAQSIDITTEGGIAPEIDLDNGTLQLNATVLPLQASQDVVWSMESGETFATVDQNGLVTAIASDAVVTVKVHAAENSSIFSTIDINIINQDSDIDANEVTITTEGGVYPDIFALGNTLQLFATVTPAEADQHIIWTIENGNDIISMDANGLVTALAEGAATVRATHIDGLVYDEILVSVWENGCTQGTVIDTFGLGFYITSGSGFGVTDDFIVEEGTTFEVSKLRLRLTTDNVDISSVTLNFLADDNERPGEVMFTIADLVPTSQKFIHDHGLTGIQYDVEIDLPEPPVFNQGRYWISPEATTSNGTAVSWSVTTNTSIGSNFYYLSGNHGWVGLEGFDTSFEITGNCTPMPVIVSTVNGDDAEIFVGETLQLEAVVTGSSNQDVIWTIESGSEFVSIDSSMIVTVTGEAVGVATIRATSVENSDHYHEIEITVIDPNTCLQEVLSNDLEDGYFFGGTINQRLAVDITVEDEQQFTIHTIVPTVVDYATEFTFIFYEDEDGLPGNVIETINGTIVHDWITGTNFNILFHRYTVELDNAITLSSGNYWMEIQTNALAWESTTASTLGQSGAFLNSNTGVWGYTTTGVEFVYKVLGLCEELLGTPDLTTFNFSYYPNPVKDYLTINSQEMVENISIYNVIGQQMGVQKLNAMNGQVDMSSLAPGVYLLTATFQEGHMKTFKVIKN